jgi:hypothetical protein
MSSEQIVDFQRAVEVLLGLIAECSAADWGAYSAGETSAAVSGRRQTYLANLVRDLDPAEPVTTAEMLRAYGPRLAQLLDAERDEPHRAVPALDAEDLSELFERNVYPELVEPGAVAGFPAETSDRPTAVVVTGPPGSGSTARVRELRSEWPGIAAAPAVIDPPLLLAYHPHAWDFRLAHEPSRTVASDVSLWTSLMLEYAAEWRNDILLGAGIADAENHAAALRDRGYHVEVERLDESAQLAPSPRD